MIVAAHHDDPTNEKALNGDDPNLDGLSPDAHDHHDAHHHATDAIGRHVDRHEVGGNRHNSNAEQKTLDDHCAHHDDPKSEERMRNAAARRDARPSVVRSCGGPRSDGPLSFGQNVGDRQSRTTCHCLLAGIHLDVHLQDGPGHSMDDRLLNGCLRSKADQILICHRSRVARTGLHLGLVDLP
ncbi:MAG: hypothetical protein WC005_07030 [Candidatus Nanopelagicales bacterium]